MKRVERETRMATFNGKGWIQSTVLDLNKDGMVISQCVQFKQVK